VVVKIELLVVLAMAALKIYRTRTTWRASWRKTLNARLLVALLALGTGGSVFRDASSTTSPSR
jgi:hypothetical protein